MSAVIPSVDSTGISGGVHLSTVGDRWSTDRQLGVHFYANCISVLLLYFGRKKSVFTYTYFLLYTPCLLPGIYYD